MKSDAPDRHWKILKLLEQTEWVATNLLPDVLGVTPMTIWRDVKSLEEKGLVRSSRGRISRADRLQDEPAFHAKIDHSQAAKDAIARFAAAHLIHEGDSLAIDGGTTTAALARQVLPAGLTILTNSLHTAQRFLDHPSRPSVYCCGGFLRQPSGTFIGREALAFFSKRRTQRYFLSASGVDAAAGITDLTLEDNEVKQAMAHASAEVVLLADRSKIGHVSLMQVLPWSRVHHFITDAPKSAFYPAWSKISSCTQIHVVK
jgi:DeoR family fructose operon transcriptional repressor